MRRRILALVAAAALVFVIAPGSWAFVPLGPDGIGIEAPAPGPAPGSGVSAAQEGDRCVGQGVLPTPVIVPGGAMPLPIGTLPPPAEQPVACPPPATTTTTTTPPPPPADDFEDDPGVTTTPTTFFDSTGLPGGSGTSPTFTSPVATPTTQVATTGTGGGPLRNASSPRERVDLGAPNRVAAYLVAFGLLALLAVTFRGAGLLQRRLLLSGRPWYVAIHDVRARFRRA